MRLLIAFLNLLMQTITFGAVIALNTNGWMRAKQAKGFDQIIGKLSRKHYEGANCRYFHS